MIRKSNTKMGSPVETDFLDQETHDAIVRIVEDMELEAMKQGTSLLDMLKVIKKARGLE